MEKEIKKEKKAEDKKIKDLIEKQKIIKQIKNIHLRENKALRFT